LGEIYFTYRMVILPIAFVLVMESLKIEKRDLKILILSGVVLSGLFLTHYRIIIVAFSYLMVYVLYELYSNRKDLQKKRRSY